MREKHSESLAMSHRQNGDKGSSSSSRGKQGRSRAGGSKKQWQLHRVADVMHKIYNNNSNNKHTDPAPKCCKTDLCPCPSYSFPVAHPSFPPRN